jgi:hypothetical protein
VPAASDPHPDAAARPRALEVGLVLVVGTVWIAWRLRNLGMPIDLAVYRTGGRHVLDGIDLYVLRSGGPVVGAFGRSYELHSPFTYPPFAALLFVPLALLTAAVVAIGWLFASLDVIPLLEEAEEEDIEIPPDELRIDVYRSSGPGGQSVNTTDSAVRITHLPTGIVAACQNERSQLQNKAVAMRILKARLAELERHKREDEMAAIRGERKSVDFGSQIRSYVLAPYQMVKDHRTEHEVGDPARVLDGDIDGFIEAELRHRASAGSAP